MSNPFEVSPTDSTGNVLPPGTRPPTATVFGILNLVFGIIGICTTLGSIGMVFVIANNPDMGITESPGMEQFQDAGYRAFLTVVNILSLALSALLIASGVGLLRFKPWGRTLSIVYSVLAVLVMIITTVGTFVLVLLPQMNNAATPQEQMAANFGVVGAVVGAVFGLIYPTLLFIFMNRRTFKAAIGS